MIFGSMPVAKALGAVLAHAVRQDGVSLKKGLRLSAGDIAQLEAAGIAEVVVARPGKDDVGEDAAALAVAETLAGAGVVVERPFTGRANVTAEVAGIFRVDAAVVDGLNGIDGAITVATLSDYRAVQAGEMVATVKIIPFAVSKNLLNGAVMAAGAGQGALTVVPFRPQRVGLISTLLRGLKPSVIDKTAALTRDRLAVGGARLGAERRVPHKVEAIADALKELAASHNIVIVFGASAIADRADVIPRAIEEAGGRVEHFGMPVDPGNLLLVGRIGSVPVIGAPGCARSPKENGFDWVLQRMMAGLNVGREAIQAMGVGGLLTEIASRPQLRDGQGRAGRAPAEVRTRADIGVVVLAAGLSSRMGGRNKLLQPIAGVPMLRRTVEQALAAAVGPVVVVTGHQHEEVGAALGGLAVRLVHNPDYAVGMAGSLKAGIAALPPSAAGALVMLGDMPLVTPQVLTRLVAVLADEPGAAAVAPVYHGRRGNPVLIGRSLFGAVAELSGDEGARRLIEASGAGVIEVAVEDAGVIRDFDTVEALSGFEKPQ